MSLIGIFGKYLNNSLSSLTCLYSKLKIRMKSISFSVRSINCKFKEAIFSCMFDAIITLYFGLTTTYSYWTGIIWIMASNSRLYCQKQMFSKTLRSFFARNVRNRSVYCIKFDLKMMRPALSLSECVLMRYSRMKRSKVSNMTAFKMSFEQIPTAVSICANVLLSSSRRSRLRISSRF